MPDSPSPDDLYKDFKSLIEAEDNKELECRKYLQYAKELLVRDTVISYEYVESELRGHVGDSDYVISGLVADETGVESVRAYVWELKAPQSYLFDAETENRLQPSRTLIKAENQLLHYYHELKGNDLLRHKFGVTHPDCVCFGGIVIGCRKRWASGKYEEHKKRKLYEMALMIRKTYIYDRLGIRLITWDHILDHLKPGEAAPGKYVQLVGAIAATSTTAAQLEIVTPERSNDKSG